MDVPKFITGGERYKDITFRLKVAGVPDDKHIVEPDLKKVVADISELPTERVYVLATYTAMLQVRDILKEQGYIKEAIGE